MPVDRRGFCAAGAAALLSSWWRGAAHRRREASWIPPEESLRDLSVWMDVASVPGVAIAVVERGELAWHRSFGIANAETKAPVLDTSLFPAASLGKPVFGYVVFRLVDEGKLDLDRPLASYYRPDDLPADPNLDRITARHVMSHTTGLRNWRNRDQKLTPDFEPGARFQYSGEGFFWLQQVVEAITGLGVDRVMRDRLFAPAGMRSATYAWSKETEARAVYGHANRGGLATQYTRNLGTKLLPIAERLGRPISEWKTVETFKAVAEADPNLPLLPNFVIPNVAGSLLCTVAEYATSLTLMMADRRRADWEIREASRVAMLTPRVELKPTLSWGLGWGLERHAPDDYFWHWGDNGSFRNFTIGDPKRRRAMVVFTNADSGPKVYQRIIQRATGLDLGAFLWV